MAILGGSPLGLIGVRSTPTRDGMSTFNAGESRNVNINDYNTGKSGGRGNVSLFTGRSKFNAWPNIKVEGTDKDTTGLKGAYKGVNRAALHNNDIYDTSILNIIEKLSGTSGALRPQDFAYLKDLGVYPNNRLIIARRFRSPVTSDYIFRKKGSLPMSVMISWVKQDEDFFTISFGEEWEDADATFTGVLNEMGKDFLGPGLGDKVGGGLGAVPLPGFTEGLQRQVLKALGVLETSDKGKDEILPAGNPNIIKEAKRRKTIGYDKAGSGLKCTFSVTMVCEYEQKFISGIDPTIVWQDILMNALQFGTSISSKYGLSPTFASKIDGWVTNPESLVVAFKQALEGILDDAVSVLTDAIAAIKKAASGEKAEEVDAETKAKRQLDELGELGKEGGTAGLIESIKDTLSQTVRKYTHQIRGIVNALSGLPSTPWHVTIGNPLKPVFAAGDMLVEDVKVTPGSDLAFNDLPSRIKVEFTLKNARNWGLEEIAANFNVGNIRVYNPIKDFTTLRPAETLLGDSGVFDESESTEEVSNGNSQVSNNAAGDNNTNIQKTTQNSQSEIINSDANSQEPTTKEG